MNYPQFWARGKSGDVLAWRWSFRVELIRTLVCLALSLTAAVSGPAPRAASPTGTPLSQREIASYRDALEAHCAGVAVEYQSYDLAGPKPACVPVGMSGHTHWDFECAPAPMIMMVRSGNRDGEYRFRCEKISVDLRLPITITLPKVGRTVLRSHEEGHRKICEHFYANAQQAAARAGLVVLGKEYVFLCAGNGGAVGHRYITVSQDAPEANRSTAAERIEVLTSATRNAASMQTNAVHLAQSEFQNEYWKYTLVRANRASEYYDQITDHGRNTINPDKAAQLAIGRFESQGPK